MAVPIYTDMVRYWGLLTKKTRKYHDKYHTANLNHSGHTLNNKQNIKMHIASPR